MAQADDLTASLSAPPRYFDNGSNALFLQPKNRTLLAAAVVATGSTNSSPFGYTTSAQADAIVANVNTIRTALIAAGILKSTANPTS